MVGSSLQAQIEYVEAGIKEAEKAGLKADYEKALIKEWKKYLPGGKKHHLWVEHCYSAQRPKNKNMADAPDGGYNLREYWYDEGMLEVEYVEINSNMSFEVIGNIYESGELLEDRK